MKVYKDVLQWKSLRMTLGISLLAVLGFAVLLVLRSYWLTQYRIANSWDAWIDAKTEIWTEMSVAARNEAIRFNLIDENELARIRAQSRRNVEEFAAEMQAEYVSPAAMEADGVRITLESIKYKISEPEKYTGAQTVSALMEAFDADYCSGHTDALAEAKYPREEWLAMLLDKGLRVGDYSDYSGSMNLRSNLVHLANDPGTWASGRNGIAPTGDWESFKEAYINRKVWEYQQIYEAKQIDPEVFEGRFMGPDGRTFLPYTDRRVYMERSETGYTLFGAELSERHERELAYEGKLPEGYDVVFVDEQGNILTEPPPTVSRPWYRAFLR